MTQQTMIPFRTDMRRMRLGALLALGLALALAGCASITVSGSGSAGTSTPSAGASGTQGTLAGDVVAGPTCPVERAEDPCPPKAVPNREIDILGANNAVVATTTTDSKGHFSVALAPGTYVVTVPIKQGLIGMRQMSDVKANITAGQVTTVKVELDTGIR
jgi:Carboxypeptidase regulatory-like domain